MVYSTGGKTYTDHPLMDEIVYNTKKIISQIIIKNDVLANSLETEESLLDWETMQLLYADNVTFDNFPFSEKYFSAYGYSTSDIKIYVEDRYAIPESDREDLLEFSIRYFNRTFEEKNNYYRTFLGLPPYGTEEQFWIPYEDRPGKIGYSSVIPASYIKIVGTENINKDLPLHQQDKTLINAIQDSGGIETLRDVYRGSNYSYILYLQDRSLDLYSMRRFDKWDIMYIPTVESLVQDKFKELYYLNRDIYLKRYYQEAYKYDSEYYDQVMIIMVLCQTFSDIITDTPEWYIRRDIFDIRSVKYFLDAYGVDFFPEIPLKYQIKIVKSLNKLIKYKSTNRNTKDILDIFDLKGTSIYKYYLFKKRIANSEESYSDDYELKFIASELGDTYDNYIKDNIYETNYDDITLQDKYWDGEDSHSYVKQKHLERDFTLEGTKYMSIEYKVSMEEYMEQIQFFVGMLLDTTIDLDDITVIIPSISDTTRLKITDLFIFMMCLSDLYEDRVQNFIFDPSQPEWEVETNYDKYFYNVDGAYSSTNESEYSIILNGTMKDSINNSEDKVWQISVDGGKNARLGEVRSVEDILSWKKKYYGKDYLKDNYISPGMFEQRVHRVFRFNEVDKDKVAAILSQRHSMFGFEKGFTLEDFGLDKYINPSECDFNTVTSIINFYNNNIAIYHNLKDRLSGRYYDENDKIEVSNYDDYKVMDFILKTYFTKDFDYDFYKLSDGSYTTSMVNVLKDRSFTLYNIFLNIMSESNIEAKKTSIRDLLNDIIYTLGYFIDSDSLDKIFAFTSTQSFTALLHYLHLMINFFKSYKVYFIDPYVTYEINDNLDDSSSMAYDNIFEFNYETYKKDKLLTEDSISMEEEQIMEDNTLSKSVSEELNISWHFDPDPYDDYDYDGQYARESEEAFKDADGAYADDVSQYPYIMLNGGNSQLGMVSLWDLDGSDARDYDIDPVVINGGGAFDPDDLEDDYHRINFNYIIDGGFARFATSIVDRAFKMVVEDHQIEANVRIAPDAFEVKEDGLYLGDIWASKEEYDDLVDDTNTTFQYYAELLSKSDFDLSWLLDEDNIDNRIIDGRDKMFNNVYYVLDAIENNELKDTLKDFVDTRVEQIENDFDTISILGDWNDLE